MRRIGAAADVARAVLYDHFPSKRALFAALLDAEQAELLSHLRAAIVADAATEQRMRATLDAFFAFAEGQPEAWRLLFPDRAPADPGAAEEHRRHRAESNRVLAGLLAPDAQRAGIDPAAPVAQAVFALQQAAVRGAVRWWRAHPEVTRADLVEAAMTALWTGVEGLERNFRG
jgi:AcrR family transcriptional regulator